MSSSYTLQSGSANVQLTGVFDVNATPVPTAANTCPMSGPVFAASGMVNSTNLVYVSGSAGFDSSGTYLALYSITPLDDGKNLYRMYIPSIPFTGTGTVGLQVTFSTSVAGTGSSLLTTPFVETDGICSGEVYVGTNTVVFWTSVAKIHTSSYPCVVSFIR